MAATGFQRDKGILMRVRPERIGVGSRYAAWGFTRGQWGWGSTATPITQAGEKWGELTLRRTAPGRWILGGFPASKYSSTVATYLPGTRLDVEGGVGLVVSQWHTDNGWPYRAMQFKARLRDTTEDPDDERRRL